MDEQQFKDRTKQLGLNVIELVEGLSSSRTSDVVARQLLRSATSIGANYRAACRGKSNADVIAKLSVVEEETDETVYWLEVLGKTKLAPSTQLQRLMSEANEILSMTVASIKTLRSRKLDQRSVILRCQSKIKNPKSKIH